MSQLLSYYVAMSCAQWEAKRSHLATALFLSHRFCFASGVDTSETYTLVCEVLPHYPLSSSTITAHCNQFDWNQFPPHTPLKIYRGCVLLLLCLDYGLGGDEKELCLLLSSLILHLYYRYTASRTTQTWPSRTIVSGVFTMLRESTKKR
jgi:hypothetical protein